MRCRVREIEQARHVVIVVAHPDDEVIGAGALLGHLRGATILHVTDGSPRDPADARRAGLATREEYAAARRRELECALRLAGIAPQRAIQLGFMDQETMLQLPRLCASLAEQLAALAPDLILTQPYEGGHPDHDSTAFAVQRCAGQATPRFEMTSYHARDGALETGVFLPNGEAAFVRPLLPEDAARKKRMLECYRSQAPVLQDFAVVPEQFRRAPRYNFAHPPHAGMLHYERLPWGLTGERWRELAASCQ